MAKENLNVRITPEEDTILGLYAAATEKTKTMLIREFIQGLRGSDLLSPMDQSKVHSSSLAEFETWQLQEFFP